MNLSYTLVEPAERLGWVLVHSVWQFALIAVVAAVLLQLLRGGLATARYAVLLAALLAVSVAPVATWLISPAADLAATTALARRAVSPPAVVPPADQLDGPLAAQPPGNEGVPSAARSKQPYPAASAATAPAIEIAWPWQNRLRPWLPSLVLVWGMGVAAFSLRPLIGWLTLRRLRRVGVSPVPPSVQALLCRAAERLQVRQHVELLQSALIPLPIIIGGLRPVILLPLSIATAIPPAGLEAILVHELAHLRRHDYLVNLLQTWIETLFFYHPALWWLSHQLRCERENCCDDVAVAALGSPVEYGRALLALEDQRATATVLALAAGGGSLLARVKRLQGQQPTSSAWQTASLATVASVPALLLTIGISSLFAAGQQDAGEPAVAAMPLDEQQAWDELQSSGTIIYGPGFHRQHLQRHLVSLERINFPEPQRQVIRQQIAAPIQTANLWRVPPDAWPLIARLRSLRELEIVASDVSGEALIQIARLPNLRHLRVVNSTCLPHDAAALGAARELEQIDITFSIFEASPEQRRQWLGDLTPAEQAWADDFLARRRNRQQTVEAAILTDRMLDALRELPKLKVLRLTNTAVSDRGLEAIAAHGELVELDLSLAEFTPTAAAALARLTSLRKFRYANVTDESVAAFAGLTKLEDLELWAEEVSDAGVEHLLSLQSLQELALRGSSVSDVGLLKLASLPNLQRLDLRYAKGMLTAEGLDEFRRLRPQCQLVLDEIEPAAEATAEAAPLQSEPGLDEESDAGADPRATAAIQPTRTWKRRWVNGETDQPLQGLEILVRRGDSPPQLLITDADGAVEVPVPQGQVATLIVRTAGWFTQGMMVAGTVQTNADAEPSVADEALETVTYKLWRGTIISGRVLQPGGEPAAGVALNLGVYINNDQWKERLEMDLAFYSWDHGQWPNWSTGVVADNDGRFEATVPPPTARGWVRVSTTDQTPFAPAEWEFQPITAGAFEVGNRQDYGDLRLQRGVDLIMYVLDADGNALAGVTLHTSGPRGPYDGRSAVSGADGRAVFLPMQPGSITVRPDARLRNAAGEVVSRDVLAVFVPQAVTIPESDRPVHLTIQAVPHTALEFQWVDRRAEKGPLAYYGTFPVSGQVPTAAGPVPWQGEVERAQRGEQEILFVKVPETLENAVLALPADRIVTARYEDDQQTTGPGRVELGDVTTPQRRIIYGNEPRPQER